MTIVYVVPPKPPSPVQEGSDENLSPQASVFSDKVFYSIFLKQFTYNFYASFVATTSLETSTKTRLQ